jgi:nitrogen regulatory protein PII
MKLVVLITAKVEAGLDIAQAWHEAGAPGATIIRAHGLHTLQEELKSGSVELPRMVVSMGAAMAAILDNMEERGEMLLSLVEDELVEKLIAAANEVLGDLTQPDHGILFVVPVEHAIGVRRHGES